MGHSPWGHKDSDTTDKHTTAAVTRGTAGRARLCKIVICRAKPLVRNESSNCWEIFLLTVLNFNYKD